MLLIVEQRAGEVVWHLLVVVVVVVAVGMRAGWESSWKKRGAVLECFLFVHVGGARGTGQGDFDILLGDSAEGGLCNHARGWLAPLRTVTTRMSDMVHQ